MLQLLRYKILLRILPIPPAPAILNEYVVDVRSVPQEHVSKGASVLVKTVSMERDFFTEDKT